MVLWRTGCSTQLPGWVRKENTLWGARMGVQHRMGDQLWLCGGLFPRGGVADALVVTS